MQRNAIQTNKQQTTAMVKAKFTPEYPMKSQKVSRGCSSTLDGVGGQSHAPAALFP